MIAVTTSCFVLGPGSGTTKKLNEDQIELLLQYVESHSHFSSRQYASWATNEFNFQVGRACIINTLMSNGFKNWKLRKLPSLTEQHRVARVTWCILHNDMDWSKVFFTDETYFVLVRAKNRYWSIQRPTVATRLQCPKLGVWGGISSRGKTELHFFTSSIDSLYYQDILDEVLIEEANTLYPDGWYLVQDNARPHVSCSTKSFSQQRSVNVLDWPSLSPDMNPVENVWALMKHEVEKSLPTTLAQLKSVIQDVWQNIEAEHFCSSMPNRIAQCLTLEGATTSY